MKDYDEVFDEISGDEDEEQSESGLLMEPFEEDEEADGFEDEDDDDDAAIRTVVMAKKDLMALLCLKISARGGIVVRVDPREERPAAQLYDEGAAAARWFNKSVATSKRNGWQVLYDGEPAFG